SILGSPRLLMAALKRTVMAAMVFLRHRGVMPFTFLAPLCPGHAAYGAEPVVSSRRLLFRTASRISVFSLAICFPFIASLACRPISGRCTCSCCRGSADCDSCVLMILPTLPPFECSSSSRCFAFRETTKCACALS
ncbi:hypothetical protein V8C86DRAFT_2907832, partial [Haematococcus lacustris]